MLTVKGVARNDATVGLRTALFLGMVFHKLLWETMKGASARPRVGPSPSPSLAKRMLKLFKGAALGALVVQTLALELFPISRRPGRLRFVGTLTYLLGLGVAVLGRVHLGRNWANLEDAQLLPGQSLVTRGVYAYIRHPIYVGDLLLLSGLQLALNSWLVLATVFPLLVVSRQVSVEEQLLSKVFEGYGDYQQQTKKFIPFLY